MKFASLAAILVLAASIATAASALAAGRDEDGIDKSAADAFDSRMFGATPATKSYACFVRKYDSEHLANHPKQKVANMKLLMTAEIPSDASTFNYSFRLGVRYRKRSTNFESFGDCGHVVAEDTGQEIRFGCGVDCDGGGLGVATNPPSWGSLGFASGSAIRRPKRPPRILSPATTTRNSGSIAPICANAPNW
jgi:hypothetical protein